LSWNDLCANVVKRASGTPTRPVLGSIVQKGKFAASAAAVEVSALNNVDLPTLGRPTIPQLKPMSFGPNSIDKNVVTAHSAVCYRGQGNAHSLALFKTTLSSRTSCAIMG